MTEQRIIEIFKDNVKACIKENTPISVVNNLPVEMKLSLDGNNLETNEQNR